MLDLLPRSLTLPHSEECERAVLGCALLEPSVLPDLAQLIQPEHFYLERHQILYRALLELQAAEIAIDYRSVQAKLEVEATFEAAGGISYMATLDLDLPDVGRVEYYADIVRERAIRRSVIQRSSAAIREMLAGGASDATAALQGLVADLEGMAQASAPGGDWLDLGTALENYMDRIEEPHPITGPKTGIQALDKLYRGFEPGKLALIGGRSGVGKTAMLIQMVAQDLMVRRPVGVISLEMPAFDLVNRLCSHILAIDSRKMKEGRCTFQETRAMIQFRQALGQKPTVFIDDRRVRSLGEILGKVRKLRRKFGVKAVYLDFLTLVPRPGKASPHEEIDRITYELAELAVREEITMLALCQLNRGPAKENRVPVVADLREAGEQAANYVMLLHRQLLKLAGGHVLDDEEEDDDLPRLYGPRGLVILGKYRDGQEGYARTWYDGARIQWWDREAWDGCQGQRGALLAQPQQLQIGGEHGNVQG